MTITQKIRFYWYKQTRIENGGLPTRDEVAYWLKHGPVKMINPRYVSMLQHYSVGYTLRQIGELFGTNSVLARSAIIFGNQRVITRQLHMWNELSKIKKNLARQRCKTCL